jgi:hypothetical protein
MEKITVFGVMQWFILDEITNHHIASYIIGKRRFKSFYAIPRLKICQSAKESFQRMTSTTGRY